MDKSMILFFTIFVKIVSCQDLLPDFFTSDPDFSHFFNDDTFEGNTTSFSNSTSNNTAIPVSISQPKVASTVEISQVKIASTTQTPTVDRSMRFNHRVPIVLPTVPHPLLNSNNKIVPRHVKNQKFIIRDFPRKQFLMAHQQQLQGASNHHPGYLSDHPRAPRVYSTDTGLELNLEPGFAVSFDFADKPDRAEPAQFLNGHYKPAYGRGHILPLRVVNSHKFPQYRGASVASHGGRVPARMQPNRHNNNYQDFRTQTQLHFNNEADKEERKRQADRSGKAMANSGKVVEFLNYEDGNNNNSSDNESNDDRDEKHETRGEEEEEDETTKSREHGYPFSKEVEETLTSGFDDKPLKSSTKIFDHDDYGFVPSKSFPFSDFSKPSRFQNEENDYDDDDIILSNSAPPAPLDDEKSEEKEQFENEYEAFKYYGHKRSNDDRDGNKDEENSKDERSEEREDDKSEEKENRVKSKTRYSKSDDSDETNYEDVDASQDKLKATYLKPNNRVSKNFRHRKSPGKKLENPSNENLLSERVFRDSYGLKVPRADDRLKFFRDPNRKSPEFQQMFPRKQ